jgi:DNA polymerase-3 subunit beta
MTTQIQLSNVEGEGKIAVPSKILLETLKLFPDTPVVFFIDEENLFLKFSVGQGEYNTPCFPADEYPAIKEMDESSNIEIKASVLHRGISKTLFFFCYDELRPAMMGVFCELTPEYISFVATDAHKLVRYRNTSVKSANPASFILPKKPLIQLKGRLAGSEEDVTMAFDTATNYVCFSFGNFKLYSILIDGKYPNYEAVIPTKNPISLVVERLPFLATVSRVSNFANQSTFQIKFSLNENNLAVSAEDIDFSNKAEEKFNGTYQGEDLEIGFNSKFLREMISNLDSDEIRFDLSVPNRAGLINPAKEDETEDILMLIMPVMLNN